MILSRGEEKMFNKLNDILGKMNHKYEIPNTTKEVLSNYVKTQNDQKAFNDLLAKIVSKIDELKGYGDIQYLIKYPIENENTEKLLSEIFSKYSEIESLIYTDILEKLNYSDKKFLDLYKNNLKRYKEIINEEEVAVNTYDKGVKLVNQKLNTIRSRINLNAESVSAPINLASFNEFTEVIGIFENITIPKELEYRVNIKKYESFIEDINLLKNILVLNDTCLKEVKSQCYSIKSMYLDELYKITNKRTGIASAKIPLTNEGKLYKEYLEKFNLLMKENNILKDYDVIREYIKFWNQETYIFTKEIVKKDEDFNLKEKVRKIQEKCLDCVKKVVSGLQVDQLGTPSIIRNLANIKKSLAKIKLPLTQSYIEEFDDCFKEYNAITPKMREQASEDDSIDSNFQFLDAYYKKMKSIQLQQLKINLFFEKATLLSDLCNSDISSKKPVGEFVGSLSKVEELYYSLKILENESIEDTYQSSVSLYDKASKAIEDYESHRSRAHQLRINAFVIFLIVLSVVGLIAALGTYSYWGAIFLKSGTMNSFPNWFFKIANVHWAHHWANWAGNTFPLVALLVVLFEALWFVITWVLWAIIWVLLVILCGVAYIICYVLVPAVAAQLVGGIFLGIDWLFLQLTNFDADDVTAGLSKAFIVFEVIALLILYFLCFI